MRSADLSGDGELEVILGSGGATVEGKVTDASGQALGRAAIALAGAEGSWPLRAGTADEQGYFQFSNLPLGTYRVHAWSAFLPEAEAGEEMGCGGKKVELGGNEKDSIMVFVNP
jgi:hypothetical protein